MQQTQYFLRFAEQTQKNCVTPIIASPKKKSELNAFCTAENEKRWN